MRDAHLYQRNTRGDPVSRQSNPTMRLAYDRISLRADQPIGMIIPNGPGTRGIANIGG